MRAILFIFRLLAENFFFIFNYLGSDIFLLLDRTLALDLLHGSGKFVIISDYFKDLYVKVCFIFCKYEKFLYDAIRYRDCYLYPLCYFEKLSLLIEMIAPVRFIPLFFKGKNILFFGAYRCCIITISLRGQDFVPDNETIDRSWDLTFLSTFDSKYLGTGLQSKHRFPLPLNI